MKNTLLMLFVQNYMLLVLKICLKPHFLYLFAFLGQAQSKDVAILKETKKTKSLYSIQPFSGGGKTRELICYNGKIVVPKKLQQRVIQWYHDYLGHPGINRTNGVGQHLWWPKMRNQITSLVTACSTCQVNKRRTSKKF